MALRPVLLTILLVFLSCSTAKKDKPCNGIVPLKDAYTGVDLFCGCGGEDCPDGSYCDINEADRYAKCCPKKQCPKPSGFGICVEACTTDADCAVDQRCCSNGCGHVCM